MTSSRPTESVQPHNLQALRSFTTALVCFLFWLWPSASIAQSHQTASPVIYIVGSGNDALDRHVTGLLADQLGDEATLMPIRDDQSMIGTDSPVVTIGPVAFSKIRQMNRDAPILALMVEKTFIQGYANRSPGQVSAIYYDVPLVRQALTGKAILPQSRQIALLASTESVEIYEDLIDQLSAYNLQARVFITDSDDQLIPTLVRALTYGDFVLAGSDDAIYNPRNIKHILLTAYRRNKIVIGPSQAYVKAGVLASSYAPFPVMAEMAGTYLQGYLAEGHFPEPDYPGEYRVEANKQVARSLNIPLPERDWIAEQVDELLQSGQGGAE
ncbi:hypothetical protein [Marinobacter halophilus]|uniref:hypothetical protein n=1 Tax=Marinobacter halophilus TaxID=1323740 RepID=UPI001D10E226|nr:hypothetical protein [Marinobacter halophilus]